MDNQIKLAFEKSKSGDKDERYEAYQSILNATDKQVEWAYEVLNALKNVQMKRISL